jgi:methionyl-tRNA synthetase
VKHYYFMGKDNIVFHTVIWPSMLMGYGAGLEGGLVGGSGAPLGLPYNVVSSEFLTMEGKKFSSSRGVVIYVKDVLARYDADALRYFLAAAGPENQDTDFTWAEFVRRNNDELVANWGNLVNRVLGIAHKNFGVVPEEGDLTAEDAAVQSEIARGFPGEGQFPLFNTVGKCIEEARLKQAIEEVMRLSALVNQYVSKQEPWKLVKEDKKRAATVLYTCLWAIDSLKTLFAPFLPFSSQRLHELLGYGGQLSGTIHFSEVTEQDHGQPRVHRVLTGDYSKREGRWEPSKLRPGQKLLPPQPLFKKLDESVVAEELARLESGAAAASTH